MLPVFAEHLPIQVHTTAETECPEIVQGVKGRHQDDFLVLISIQEIACPKEICKKNFASILLPADLDSNRTVAYGCGGERQQIDWKAISLNIRSQQKDNVLEEVPSEYIKEVCLPLSLPNNWLYFREKMAWARLLWLASLLWDSSSWAFSS